MIEGINTLDRGDFHGKTVLVRVDLNLPMVSGTITDVYRLKQIIPTLKYLIQQQAKVVVISHYGRPKGKFVADMSLASLVNELSVYLGTNVLFAVDVLSEFTIAQVRAMKNGEVILLENIRFHLEEEKNNQAFAKDLSALGDVYVNDTFSCSHRAHASIVGIPKYLPSYCGLLLQSEIENIKKYTEGNIGKVMAITGGAKVSTKIQLLRALVDKADLLVIGGAMANTFLEAAGVSVGASLYEKECIPIALDVLRYAKQKKCKGLIPNDVVTSSALEEQEPFHVVPVSHVGNDDMILDVGPEFTSNIIEELHRVNTVIWNGPLGAAEYKPFDIATAMIARAIAGLTASGKLVSVAGGGDVVASINAARLLDGFTYVSTGGGAFLEYLEGAKLPGIKALEDNVSVAKLRA